MAKLPDADELSEDRMIALRKRAEVESKHVIIFNNATDLSQSLNRHATVN